MPADGILTAVPCRGVYTMFTIRWRDTPFPWRDDETRIRMLQHVVLVKVKPGTPRERIDAMFREIGTLPGLIPGIVGYSGGANNSPEGKAEGYTHGFVMTLADAAARDAYLPHPEHRRVAGDFLRPISDGVLVFDYEEAG